MVGFERKPNSRVADVLLYNSLVWKSLKLKKTKNSHLFSPFGVTSVQHCTEVTIHLLLSTFNSDISGWLPPSPSIISHYLPPPPPPQFSPCFCLGVLTPPLISPVSTQPPSASLHQTSVSTQLSHLWIPLRGPAFHLSTGRFFLFFF